MGSRLPDFIDLNDFKQLTDLGARDRLKEQIAKMTDAEREDYEARRSKALSYLTPGAYQALEQAERQAQLAGRAGWENDLPADGYDWTDEEPEESESEAITNAISQLLTPIDPENGTLESEEQDDHQGNDRTPGEGGG
jgi:hypothetical protein